ncbi:MurR/RpiR family transcriptional regulator [Mameliella alba]|uniref:MurR/RpiR family transcriptional regulator n=1 Tax=Mameliella alba TaxID=561184 RepID=UPI000B537F55|nr:MurR/RpiR family transcriptional regulator [Mameliella alba]MBY6122274.1 MurR/RpiR family transcriptional regulator [Mameliella alba]OWV39717.1 sugar isomerase [Mameliella alba]OWV53782.1 sugar isomerase [Mameliella alba]
MPAKRLETRIAHRYGGLSHKLREAADYVIAHPVEVATRSLRSVSAASAVSPATFSRLARALDFTSYEELRELSRQAIGDQVVSFAEKATQLQTPGEEDASMLDRQAGACMSNIASLAQGIDRERLQEAVDALARARRVTVFGAFASHGIAEHLAYLANYFQSDWTVLSRAGSALSAAIGLLQPGDVFLVITKTPYARRAVFATQMARESGATTIVLTDTHASPALMHADLGFCVPSDSPQFFSSYVATLALMETLVAMLVAQSEDDIGEKIRLVEERNRRLGDFWADETSP